MKLTKSNKLNPNKSPTNKPRSNHQKFKLKTRVHAGPSMAIGVGKGNG